MFRRRNNLSVDVPTSAVVSKRRRPKSTRWSILHYITVAVLVLLISSTISRKDKNSLNDSKSFSAGFCKNFNGLLHISQGDSEGAAGTIFFLFVLNQLLYAEKHSLIPFVHLNNVSHYVYDPIVHGRGDPISFEVKAIVNASWIAFEDPILNQQVPFAGPPSFPKSFSEGTKLTLLGNGVWNSYFYPVSEFQPGLVSCNSLPLVRLSHQQIIPALHVNCPYAVRAWRYGGLPPSIQKSYLSYDEWFAPMRDRASRLVDKYIKFRPHLYELAKRANPFKQCIAVHIRHSDKANKRRKIPVKKFLPYVQAFAEEKQKIVKGNNFSVYIATDSHYVMSKIRSDWPSEIVDRIQYQKRAVRSNDTTPVFSLSSHHTTNTEVLVDIIAMSKCQYLLHGLSAVSEATHYINSDLHKKKRSVNLEIQNHATPDQFRAIINNDKGF